MQFFIVLNSLVLINVVSGLYDEVVPFDVGNPFEVSNADPWSSKIANQLPKSVHYVESTLDASNEGLQKYSQAQNEALNLVPVESGTVSDFEYNDSISDDNENSDAEDVPLTFPFSSDVQESLTTSEMAESPTTTYAEETKSSQCKIARDEVLEKLVVLLHWVYMILCFLVVKCSVISLVYVTVLISNFIKTKSTKTTKVYIISAPLKEISKC